MYTGLTTKNPDSFIGPKDEYLFLGFTHHDPKLKEFFLVLL